MSGCAALNEFFAHEQGDEDHGEDCDSDGENEYVAPACVCEVSSYNRSYRVAKFENQLFKSIECWDIRKDLPAPTNQR